MHKKSVTIWPGDAINATFGPYSLGLNEKNTIYNAIQRKFNLIFI